MHPMQPAMQHREAMACQTPTSCPAPALGRLFPNTPACYQAPPAPDCFPAPDLDPPRRRALDELGVQLLVRHI